MHLKPSVHLYACLAGLVLVVFSSILRHSSNDWHLVSGLESGAAVLQGTPWEGLLHCCAHYAFCKGSQAARLLCSASASGLLLSAMLLLLLWWLSTAGQGIS